MALSRAEQCAECGQCVLKQSRGGRLLGLQGRTQLRRGAHAAPAPAPTPTIRHVPAPIRRNNTAATKVGPLSGSPGRAGRAEVAPGAAHVVPAAAVAVGQRHRQPVRALPGLAQVREATAHAPVYTKLLIWTWNEMRIAKAVIVALSVHALAVRTDVGIFALVDVFAVVGEPVPALARRALAREGPHGVDALAPLAQPWDGSTLVDVLALLGGEVAQVSGRAVEVCAALAGVPPGHAHRGAAQLLGADHALQRARAQAAAHVGVARPCSPVDFTARP